MSIGLLKVLSAFVTDAGVTTGYATKYYRWSDADLKGAGGFILYRMAGTAGSRDAFVQRPDVRVLIVAPPSDAEVANNLADEVFKLFAGVAKPSEVLKLEPQGTVMGPFYVDNNRPVYEIIVRCFVEDH